ncbi:MAG: hypothetical protein P4L77_12190 [Sulfuriferula sp.]|nr:hypothetical protein [Sulfuriferula sp.]
MTSFRKAVQKMAKPDGYEEYLEALLIYKRACSIHRKTLLRLEGLNDPASRLERADSSTMYKVTCKAYSAAQRKYAQLIARSKLKEKGIDTSVIEQAQAVGVEFPLSLKDMIEQERRNAIPQRMTQEEFDKIANAARAVRNRGTEDDYHNKTRNLFMADKTVDPMLDDFESLPPVTLDEFDKL